MKSVRWLNLAFVCLVWAGAAQAGEDLSRRVLVVYNESEPESKPLADYYARRRDVPTNQVFGIRVRSAETITRREFNEHVRDPILRFMNDRGLLFQLPVTVKDPVLGKMTVTETYDNKITFLALIYGVPLRVEEDASLIETNLPTNLTKEMRRNEAAVDSELTWLPNTGLPLASWLPNPFFQKSPRFDAALNNKMFLVSRLDGPNPQIVRRMIDDALATERTGLLGRCYFDARGINDAGVVEGDKWILNSARIFRDFGFETETDEKPGVFDENYPMTNVAVYAGWYAGDCTGALARAEFKFRPGAVAYHIHSWSAGSLRTTTSAWVGPLLAKGAAASFGNVYEPFLGLTPHVDLFFKRLLDGAPFAEAAWHSQPVLSWQTTFVGDPLYRPFALSIDSQIAQLEADRNPDVAWAYLRKINILANIGSLDQAEQLCREKAAALNSPLLAEKYLQLQAARLKKN